MPGVTRTILDDLLTKGIIEQKIGAHRNAINGNRGRGNLFRLFLKNENSTHNNLQTKKQTTPKRLIESFEQKTNRVLNILKKKYPKWINTKIIKENAGYKRVPGVTRLILDDLLSKGIIEVDIKGTKEKNYRIIDKNRIRLIEEKNEKKNITKINKPLNSELNNNFLISLTPKI